MTRKRHKVGRGKRMTGRSRSSKLSLVQSQLERAYDEAFRRNPDDTPYNDPEVQRLIRKREEFLSKKKR